MRRPLIATWGVVCVLALLGQAVVRLSPIAWEAWRSPSLTVGQRVGFVLWVVFNAYAEGYRGFHLRFSPRVVARAFYLGDHPRPVDVVLALPYVMSLYHARRRQRIVSWTFIVLLVVVIAAVRALPQPWRGLIDGGVVVGLLLGTLSVVYFYVRGLAGDPPPVPDLPDARTPDARCANTGCANTGCANIGCSNTRCSKEHGR